MVDPVRSGIVTSLARPGGNVTGFTIDTGLEIVGKRLEFFRLAVPTASRIAWLTRRRTAHLPITAEVHEAAGRAAVTLVDVVLEAPIDAATYRRAFVTMSQERVHAVWTASVGENLEHRWLIAELALTAKLPTMFAWQENVEAGGLMSYGNDVSDFFRRSADYANRILKGANPAGLPIQQPSKFELVINLKTARALCIDMPEMLLLRADEVIQ